MQKVSYITLILGVIVSCIQLSISFAMKRQQFRPYVTAIFTATQLIQIEISNIGSIPAHKVAVRITPEPLSVADIFRVDQIPAFSDSISVLMPGQVLRFNFDLASNRFAKEFNGVNRFKFNISYETPHKFLKSKKYSNTFESNIGQYGGASISPRGSELIASKLDALTMAISRI